MPQDVSCLVGRAAGLSALAMLAALAACPAAMGAGAVATAPINTSVDIALTTTHAGANGYLEDAPRITFSGPTGQTGRARAFWDGGGRFVFRFAPTAAGEWRYRVRSTYPDLEGRTAAIRATAPGRPGFVRVDSQYPRAFRRQTGEWFYWLGDTAWNFFLRATPEQAAEYARLRRGQGFTIVQVGLVHHWGDAPASNEGGAFFFDGDADRLNPGFFQAVDRKMRALTAQRLVPVLFLTWGNEVTSLKPEQFERFIRYAAARYAAFDILWSLSGEWDYARDRIADWRRWGALLHSEDPYGHPISIHAQQWGTSLQSFADQDWLGFSLQQSYVHTAGVHPMALEDRARGKPMPIVNGEAQYEGLHYPRGGLTSADLVRRNAWAVITGGAFHTYGGKGIWDFDPQVWRAAVTLPGALQVAALGRLMRAQEWWTMEPADARLQVKGGGEAFCLAGPTSWVVYVNPGEKFSCRLNLERPMRLRWLDPRSGDWSGPETAVQPPTLDLHAPGPGDWVAVLR